MSVHTCRICGSSRNHATYNVLEMMYGLGHEFIYFQCADCGCLQIRDFPDDMSGYYPQDYYSLTPFTVGAPLHRWSLRQRNRYAVWGQSLTGWLLYQKFPEPRLRALAPLHIKAHTRILDVGCGNGYTLFCLHELGLTNLLGVDPHIPQDIEYEGGLQIIKGELADIQGQWDVITLQHSLEHMPNQEQTLRMAAQLLAPEGVIVVRIPVVSSWAWRHYGVNWVQLDAPRHFYLHSENSMQYLAGQCGLTVFKTMHDAKSLQFWGSELYRRGIPLIDETGKVDPGQYFSTQQLKAFATQTRRLNRQGEGDQAVFYLHKQ